MVSTAARIEQDMDPVAAASRMDTDEVVRLDELRPWLECLAECAYQANGYRRIKNPRIWSVHDLEVLTSGRMRGVLPQESAASEAIRATEEAPVEEGAVAIRASMEGSVYQRPAPGSPAFIETWAPVAAGATIGLIEVMKTFTPVKSAQGGTWLRWVVEEGASVVPGQLLGWMRPS